MITSTPIRAGNQAETICLKSLSLLDMIVRCFPRNDDVVHVALTKARVRDANEAGIVMQVLDRRTAQVAHAGAQSADKLVDHRFQLSAIGHAAFNAFRNKLGEAVL